MLRRCESPTEAPVARCADVESSTFQGEGEEERLPGRLGGQPPEAAGELVARVVVVGPGGPQRHDGMVAHQVSGQLRQPQVLLDLGWASGTEATSARVVVGACVVCGARTWSTVSLESGSVVSTSSGERPCGGSAATKLVRRAR